MHKPLCIENSTGVSLSAIWHKKYIMAVKVNMIEQSQGVKFKSSALNGLRGLAAFHVMVFHTIHYSNFSFSINGTVRRPLFIYTAIPKTTSLSRRRIHSIKLKYFEKAKISWKTL